MRRFRTIGRMGATLDDRDSRGDWLGAIWQPAGVVYLCFCVVGLAAGLWPEKIIPSFAFPRNIPLPVLQTLAVAQTFFFLLIYPLVLMYRQQREKRTPGSAKTSSNSQRPTSDSSIFALLLEFSGMLLVTLPLYVLAAWLSDATGKDAIRALLAVSVICPLGVLAGRLLARPAWRGVVMLLLLVITFGLPGAWYLCTDFLFVRCRFLEFSPMIFVWTQAGAR